VFAARVPVRRRVQTEAEKPFWISFADLMTALMVLFLVVMGVALLAVTTNVSEQDRQAEQHRQQIDLILDRFAQAAAHYEGVQVDRERRVIDFGDRARFGFGQSNLSEQQAALLRQFVPEVLQLADDDLGHKLLKRIVVEGYTDRTGSYLSNLSLSLQRSERVLCALLAVQGEHLLSLPQKQAVRNLFLVGGYAFNTAKDTDEQSRRVEMKLEFLGVGEARPAAAAAAADGSDFGDCALR
jgi:outer membrane protein OmpA-like peptidoglycan-associated protein